MDGEDSDDGGLALFGVSELSLSPPHSFQSAPFEPPNFLLLFPPSASSSSFLSSFSLNEFKESSSPCSSSSVLSSSTTSKTDEDKISETVSETVIHYQTQWEEEAQHVQTPNKTQALQKQKRQRNVNVAAPSLNPEKQRKQEIEREILATTKMSYYALHEEIDRRYNLEITNKKRESRPIRNLKAQEDKWAAFERKVRSSSKTPSTRTEKSEEEDEGTDDEGDSPISKSGKTNSRDSPTKRLPTSRRSSSSRASSLPSSPSSSSVPYASSSITSVQASSLVPTDGKNSNIASHREQCEPKPRVSKPQRLAQRMPTLDLQEAEDHEEKKSEDDLLGMAPDLFEVIRHLRTLQTKLHVSAVPLDLVCRGSEKDCIVNFVKACTDRQRGGALYVSGAPGTGKSLSVQFALDTIKATEWGNALCVTILNSMSIKNPTDFYPTVLRQLTGQPHANVTPAEATTKLQDHLAQSDAIWILVVDEMDNLLTGNQTLLYQLFGWATRPSFKLALIGIANALDLTERFLPRLRERKCEPQVLTFHPYDRDQLSTIVSQRLILAQNEKQFPGGTTVLFPAKVIHLLTMKVATIGGDVRKCMDLCRQCLDSLERLLLKDPTTKPVVTFALMSMVCKNSMGNSMREKIEGLPFHQQLLLSVATITAKYAKGEITQAMLRSNYALISSARLLASASSVEFLECLTALVENGLLKTDLSFLRRGLKKGVSDKVVMNCSWDEVSNILLSAPETSNAVKSVLAIDLNSSEFAKGVALGTKSS